MYYTRDHYATFDEVQVVEGESSGGSDWGGLLDALAWWLTE